MYNMSEADLFPGFETNGFDPLKAQFRRAEIYKRAFDNVVKAINTKYDTIKLVPEWWIEQAKEQVDNAAQS